MSRIHLSNGTGRTRTEKGKKEKKPCLFAYLILKREKNGRKKKRENGFLDFSFDSCLKRKPGLMMINISDITDGTISFVNF
jgi:hypothetical protein